MQFKHFLIPPVWRISRAEKFQGPLILNLSHASLLFLVNKRVVYQDWKSSIFSVHRVSNIGEILCILCGSLCIYGKRESRKINRTYNIDVTEQIFTRVLIIFMSYLYVNSQ